MTNTAAEHSTPSLFQSERQREIATATLQGGRVEVAELAVRYNVTTETIRRDLSDLQQHKVVRRVHGGAVPWETTGFEPLLSRRNDHHDLEKQRLATAAIAEIPDAGSIIIDSGSTLTSFAHVIPANTSVRIVTNALNIAHTLAERCEADVIVVGGKVRKNTLAMVDAAAVAAIEPLAVDTLFVSCDGLTASNGLSTPYREEAALKRAMIGAARRVVALVDHSKFGKEHFTRFAEWSDIDVLITNTEADQAEVQAIEATGTIVILT